MSESTGDTKRDDVPRPCAECECADLTGPAEAKFCMGCGHAAAEHAAPANETSGGLSNAEPGCTHDDCECESFDGPDAARFCRRCGHPATEHASDADALEEDAERTVVIPMADESAADSDSDEPRVAADDDDPDSDSQHAAPDRCTHDGCECESFSGPEDARFCRDCGHPATEHSGPSVDADNDDPPAEELTTVADDSANLATSTVMLPGPGEGGCFSCDCNEFDGPADVKECWTCGHARSAHRRPASEAEDTLVIPFDDSPTESTLPDDPDRALTGCESCDCEGWDAPTGHRFCANCGHSASMHGVELDEASAPAGALDRPAYPADRIDASEARDELGASSSWRSLIVLVIVLMLVAIALVVALQWRAERRNDLLARTQQSAETTEAKLRELKTELADQDAEMERLNRELATLNASATTEGSVAYVQHARKVARQRYIDANEALERGRRAAAAAREETRDW